MEQSNSATDSVTGSRKRDRHMWEDPSYARQATPSRTAMG